MKIKPEHYAHMLAAMRAAQALQPGARGPENWSSYRECKAF